MEADQRGGREATLLMPAPVLLLVRELNIGGTERQLTETAKHLDRDLFEPHVGCFRSSGIRGDELRAAGVPVVEFPVESFKSPSAAAGVWHLRRYVRRNSIRLVHTFDVPMTVFGVPAARLARAPVVLSSQRAYRDLVSQSFRRLLRWTDRLADGVVVNCEAMREHLRREEGVPLDRIHLCYNGIDTTAFRPPVERNCSRLVVGVVCALRPEKGLETLIDACGLVARHHPELELWIVGSGPEEASLRERAAAVLPGRVRFEPTTQQVASYLREIDIFVLPSKSEAFSNSLMEAMACGCAVIASNVGGNPELARAGETGLLFPPGNVDELVARLREMVEDANLRRRLAGNATRLIHEQFSTAAAARQMGSIYTRMLSGADL